MITPNADEADKAKTSTVNMSRSSNRQAVTVHHT